MWKLINKLLDCNIREYTCPIKKQIFLKQDTKSTNSKEKHWYIWKILKLRTSVYQNLLT